MDRSNTNNNNNSLVPRRQIVASDDDSNVAVTGATPQIVPIPGYAGGVLARMRQDEAVSVVGGVVGDLVDRSTIPGNAEWFVAALPRSQDRRADRLPSVLTTIRRQLVRPLRPRPAQLSPGQQSEQPLQQRPESQQLLGEGLAQGQPSESQQRHEEPQQRTQEQLSTGQPNVQPPSQATGAPRWPQPQPSEYQLRQQQSVRPSQGPRQDVLPPQGPRQQKGLSWAQMNREQLEKDREMAARYSQNVADRDEVEATIREANRRGKELRRDFGRGFRGPRAMAPISVSESFRQGASGNGSRRRRPRGNAPPGAQRQTSSRIECGNCGIVGHTIRHCVHPSLDGFVHGCPSCNSANHERREDCAAAPKNLTKLLERAVTDRQRRPPLAAYRDWLAILEQAKTTGLSLPMSFPWMPSFFEDLRSQRSPGNVPWETYSYRPDSLNELPIDFRTAYLGHVEQNFVALSHEMDNAPMASAGPWYHVDSRGEDAYLAAVEGSEDAAAQDQATASFEASEAGDTDMGGVEEATNAALETTLVEQEEVDIFEDKMEVDAEAAAEYRRRWGDEEIEY